jgi:branched-chain amino acid transport system permease protein
MLLTGAIAYAVGSPALRLHGHYLAMFTLGLGIIARIVFEQAESITNGFDGIAGIPAFHLWVVHFDSDFGKYGLVVGVLALSVLVARNLVNSRVGRALRALHGSEDAANACGINVARAKLGVFVLSAMLASVAGSLYAHTIGFVSPEPFGFQLSVELVVMVVVGGAGSVWGPIAGAALFTVLNQLLQKVGERVALVASLDTVLFGLVLVVVVIFWGKGLVSLRLPPRFRRARPAPDGGA